MKTEPSLIAGEERLQLSENVGGDFVRQSAYPRRLSRPPVEASNLVTQHGTKNAQALGQDYLEGVAFNLTGDWTQNRQPRDSVVSARR